MTLARLFRLLAPLGLLVGLLMAAPVHAEMKDMEYGVDRPGGDYKNFNLSTDRPSLCEDRCAAEPKCRAWTFVRPGVQGPNARCWLKDTVPDKVRDETTVSGVKEVSTGSFERDRDRPGKDYRNFNLGSPRPELCQQACEDEARCRAWTYVKPGVQASSARCWLKDGVPRARVDDCCVSGVM
jgi:hypothetical protein